jgi:hypothetical protein
MNTFLKFRLKSNIQSAVVGSFLLAATVAFGFVVPATAWADDLKAKPFEFVGKAGDCGTGYAAGSRIVTAKWLTGLGLPDNGGLNSLNPPGNDNPNKTDPHYGLPLSKNGPTPDCSAPGATIKGVKGITVGLDFELGFDYRNGSHCGAGAPRFNVVVKPLSGPDEFHFVGGCSNGTKVIATQDPSEWTRVRFNVTSTTANQSFPPISIGSKIVSIDLIFDEGTDTPTAAMPPADAGNPAGIGLAVVDNIDINGVLITDKKGHREGNKDGKDDDDD